ncbi:hypothetical protein WA577_002002, partial [Blastocystis sp. JDR]
EEKKEEVSEEKKDEVKEEKKEEVKEEKKEVVSEEKEEEASEEKKEEVSEEKKDEVKEEKKEEVKEEKKEEEASEEKKEEVNEEKKEEVKEEKEEEVSEEKKEVVSEEKKEEEASEEKKEEVNEEKEEEVSEEKKEEVSEEKEEEEKKPVEVKSAEEKKEEVNEEKEEEVSEEKKEMRKNQPVVAFNTTYTINGKTHFITVSRNGAMKELMLEITKKTGKSKTVIDANRKGRSISCSFYGEVYAFSMPSGSTYKDLRAILALTVARKGCKYCTNSIIPKSHVDPQTALPNNTVSPILYQAPSLMSSGKTVKCKLEKSSKAAVSKLRMPECCSCSHLVITIPQGITYNWLEVLLLNSYPFVTCLTLCGEFHSPYSS